jgi:membrane protease YdiL (CAAX protease family)
MTFTILGFAMFVYCGFQYFGAYIYGSVLRWLENQGVGGYRWLLGLFYSDWTGLLVQWVFTLGLSFLLAFLILCFVPKVEDRFMKLPGDDMMICLVIAMGAGYVFNFLGSAVNTAFAAINGRDVLDMNPVIDMMSDLTPGMLIYSCILGPFTEELMFRGILLKRARRFGDRTAVVYCAIMFGLMHGNLSQFLYAMVIGLLLGYLAVKSNGLRYNVILHIMINSYSTVLVIGEELLEGAGLDFAVGFYELATLAVILLLIVGAIIFLVQYGPRMYREVTLANGWPTPFRKYVYLNPGFFFYAVLCIGEMLAYLL